MTEAKKPVAFPTPEAERAIWERPELRRLNAADAESTATGSNDNFSQNS